MRTEFPVRLYRHLKTGGIYQWMGEATIEASKERAVVYKHISDGSMWIRPSEEFYERFEPAGQITM